jgi:hypothetical protein
MKLCTSFQGQSLFSLLSLSCSARLSSLCALSLYLMLTTSLHDLPCINVCGGGSTFIGRLCAKIINGSGNNSNINSSSLLSLSLNIHGMCMKCVYSKIFCCCCPVDVVVIVPTMYGLDKGTEERNKESRKGRQLDDNKFSCVSRTLLHFLGARLSACASPNQEQEQTLLFWFLAVV